MQSLEKNNFSPTSLKVGIILPAYNEYENIFELLKQIESAFKNKLIIIIDDSTNDQIGKKISQNENLIYHRRQKKLGRGSAVLFGLKEMLKNSEIDLFVEIDTDLSSHPKEALDNLKYFLNNKIDLLIFSRYLKGSEIINWSLLRRSFSFCANRLAKFLLKVPVSDYTMGYRIYSRRAAQHIVNNCGNIGGGFIVLSETLVELYTNNFKIRDIKTKFTNREKGKSTVNIKLVLSSLLGLLKLYFSKRKKIHLFLKENKTSNTTIADDDQNI